MAAMNLGAAAGGFGAAVVVLRIVVLLSTAVVAGTGLVRPMVRAATRRTVVVLVIAAVIAAVADIVSVAVAHASVPFVVVQVLLTAAVPVLLRRPAAGLGAGLALAVLLVAEMSSTGSGFGFLVDLIDTGAVSVWLGLTLLSATAVTGWQSGSNRLREITWIVAGVLVVAGIGKVLLSGVAFDRRLYQTEYGLAVLSVLVLALITGGITILVLRRQPTGAPRRAYQLGTAAVAAGFLVWSAGAAIPAPAPLPTPGTPVLAQVSLAGKQFPVLVTPQRPGPNLVHFPPDAGTGISVDPGDGRPVLAAARPGAEGTWAEVNLPAGRGRLVVTEHGQRGTVALDTGDAPGPAGATGVDGPECASAALGPLIADRQLPLTACPSDALDPADAQALRDLVGYLDSRQVKGITLVGDPSPRSAQAAATVRQAAATDHLTVASTPTGGNALVVVSGWAAAAAQLTTAANLQATNPTYEYGLYLAPWLLTPPIVNSVASSSLPLRFDPRVATSLSYSVSVQNLFGGENATPDGYYRWLAAQGQPVGGGEVQIYSAAQVDAMPMDMADMAQPYPGQWIPNGTIVPVSGVLQR